MALTPLIAVTRKSLLMGHPHLGDIGVGRRDMESTWRHPGKFDYSVTGR